MNHDMRPPRLPHEAIRSLYAATLRSALDDLRRYRDDPSDEAQAIVRDALRWMAGAEAHLPFARVCEVLNVDADAVRKAWEA